MWWTWWTDADDIIDTLDYPPAHRNDGPPRGALGQAQGGIPARGRCEVQGRQRRAWRPTVGQDAA